MRLARKIFPFLDWFPELTPETLRVDFISGLTVALVLVPQSMAYAQLAGLPAYYGLYAAFLPPMVANLFGSSRQLATGPVAVVSLMTAASLEPLATAGSEQFIAYAILLALMVGIFQFMLGVARLGLVVNFLSHPVVNGFTNAAALIIATSQLDKIFGVSVEKAEHHYETVLRVVESAVHWTHLPTLGMAAVAFAIMVGVRRFNPRLPNVLIAVAVTSLIAWGFGFEHNRSAPAREVRSPQLAAMVEDFNAAITSQRRMEELRSEGTQAGMAVAESADEFCQRCHSERDVNAFELGSGPNGNGGVSERALVLHQMAGLLDTHLEELKEAVAASRTALRSIVFVRVPESSPDAGLYQQEQLPDGAPTDGRHWRLKVGGRPLDPEALVFVGGGTVVGEIPRGLPSPKLPRLDASVIPKLIAPAIIISLLGFMEAISIAKAMAAKTRQRLDPNQELIGQGLANMVGCVFQSYAVSGSFSRSAVNLQAGARTGIANVFSSGVVMIVLLFLSPLLYYLPQAVLAAIIMMAVIGLLNVGGFVHAWRTSPFDGVVSVITFVGTLALAPHLEWGIFMGVALSLGGYLYRSMRPRVARLVPAADGTVRDADRDAIGTCRYVAVVGFEGPLNFASTSYLEDEILRLVAEHRHLRYLLLSGRGISEIDASGEETLRHLVDRLRASNIQVAITGLSGKVEDVLRRSHLYDRIGEENIFATDARAIAAIYAPAHRDTDEVDCPFLGVVPRLAELSLHPDGTLRDAARHRLPLCRHIAALRIESPVNRANVRYVEEWIFALVANRPDLRHVLIVAHDMSSIDSEGAQRLGRMVEELRKHQLAVSFSDMSDQVVQTFIEAGEGELVDSSHLYPTEAVAVASIWAESHAGSDERACPLHPLAPQLTELGVHPSGGLRDASRFGLRLCPSIALLRFDSAAGFAGDDVMIAEFERWRSGRPDIKTVIFVCSAITRLEPSQAENLLALVRHARGAGLRVALCRVPDPAFETLARTGVVDSIGVDDIYPSVSGALAYLWGETHPTLVAEACPLEGLLPHVTELSLHPDGSLRDARRHGLARCRHIAMVRFDGRLDYSTLKHFTRGVESVVASLPDLHGLIVAGHTLERIDEIAAEGLLELLEQLRDRGLRVCVSGLRDEVLDVLRRTGIDEAIGAGCLFPTQAAALEAVHAEAHRGSSEERCPLREVVEVS